MEAYAQASKEELLAFFNHFAFYNHISKPIGETNGRPTEEMLADAASCGA
jgi:hypothetical protein